MTLVYAKKKKFPYSYTLPCIYPLVNLIRFAYAKKKKKKNATTKIRVQKCNGGWSYIMPMMSCDIISMMGGWGVSYSGGVCHGKLPD